VSQYLIRIKELSQYLQNSNQGKEANMLLQSQAQIPYSAASQLAEKNQKIADLESLLEQSQTATAPTENSVRTQPTIDSRNEDLDSMTDRMSNLLRENLEETKPASQLDQSMPTDGRSRRSSFTDLANTTSLRPRLDSALQEPEEAKEQESLDHDSQTEPSTECPALASETKKKRLRKRHFEKHDRTTLKSAKYQNKEAEEGGM
jgi:hypothetical protein